MSKRAAAAFSTSSWVALAMIGCAFAGCADSHDSTEGSVEEYCVLVAAMNESGREIFSSLGENPTPEEFIGAYESLYEMHEADILRMAEIAPEEIRDDVRGLAAFMKSVGGGGRGANLDRETIDREAGAASDDRMNEFEEENCSDPAPNSDPSDGT